MATYTSHLNLKLPDYSDTADINDLNDNFKKIDDAIASGGTGGGTGGGIVTETDPTVPSWAKQPSKPTYTAAEVGALPDTTVIPTVPSALPNPQPIVINGISYDGSERKEITVSAGDGGSITETDPTVPAWAKAENKPSYTAEEVGALPSTYKPPVTSVNGKTGAVSLVASDVGALPNTTVIPTVPTALKNPYPLTINGVSYDGSEAKTVTIESTGGGASVELDTTLTQYGKAADAGAVGNAIAQETAAREAAVNSLNQANAAQDTRLTALEQASGVTDEQVQTAVNNYLTENPVSGALTANEKTLMLALFKSAEYTSNVKAAVAQLEAIWTGGSTITFNVTNNLSHVSTDNEASTTAGGMTYTATLTADEGYTLSEVTVTMDGEDVTADVYADGVINIASVLGDIVIAAKAVEQVSLDPVYALSEPLVFDGSTMKEIDTGYSFYRSDGADMSFSVCVDFQNIAAYSTLFWTGTNEYEYASTSLLGIYKHSYYINMFVLGKNPGGNIWSNSSKRYRVIMSHEADSADATLHVWVEGESEYTTYTLTDVTKKITSQNVNVILGGFFTNNENYQTATMYDFKIYERALSVDEVKAFMGVA